ncbi:hypothetical protein [Kitasatospora sp. MBT63]|uniref:hypothetical protein n=1 Tax=Kitasatospora sp. MBT63 TaxID=1444768 RepID=UPI000AC4A69C|nr:hypothetical protein [Kitasatospora sp. MBT63]
MAALTETIESVGQDIAPVDAARARDVVASHARDLKYRMLLDALGLGEPLVEA